MVILTWVYNQPDSRSKGRLTVAARPHTTGGCFTRTLTWQSQACWGSDVSCLRFTGSSTLLFLWYEREKSGPWFLIPRLLVYSPHTPFPHGRLELVWPSGRWMPVLGPTTDSKERKLEECREEPGINLGDKSWGKIYSTGIHGKPTVGLNHGMAAYGRCSFQDVVLLFFEGRD